MLELVANIASWAFIVGGIFFLVTGAIGLVRMPDVYTRMHGASLIDSLGSLLLIVGLIIQAETFIVASKLALIYVIIFFTTPVASHAVAQAALVAKVEPELAEDRRPSRQTPSTATSTDAPAETEDPKA
ncbi:MAG: monovalent cation/H(+) antiporter subunit G [Pseudomonadota bacterium]